MTFEMREESITKLEEAPEHLLNYQKKYEENFLFVKKEQIIEAVKDRYRKFEEIMKPILKRQGHEYSRIEKNKFMQDSTVVMITRVSWLNKENGEMKLEFLDPSGKGQRVEAVIDQDFDGDGILFKNQMICFEGNYSNETVTVKKLIKRKDYLN